MKRIAGFFGSITGSIKASEFLFKGITTLLLAAGAVVIMIPLAFMVSTSLKDPGQLRSDANTLIPCKPQTAEINGEKFNLYQVTVDGVSLEMAMIKKAPGGMAFFADPAKPDELIELKLNEQTALYSFDIHWENYPGALNAMPFFRYLGNTLIVTFVGMFGMLFSSSLVAYGFSRFRAPWLNVLFLLLLSTIMLPSQVRLIPLENHLMVTPMNVFWVDGVTPTESITREQEKMFKEATVLFLGAVISVIGDKLVDAYLHMHVVKDLWEALESKFGASDAVSEMYVMEQFHDYKMVDHRSVLEQAHEIICIAKELEVLKCNLPGMFVAGCIIAKLPNSWRNFATTLKHQRREFSIEDIIAHLSVEQNSRAKDSNGRAVESSSAANMVHQRNFNSHEPKGKNSVQQNTDFKKKGKKPFKKNKKGDGCYTCGSEEHWANKCPNKYKKPGREGIAIWCGVLGIGRTTSRRLQT